MLTIGLDVHQRLSTICVLDTNGKVVKERTIHGGWDRLLRELEQIEVPFQICYEASCGYMHNSHVLDVKGRSYRLRDLERAVVRSGCVRNSGCRPREEVKAN